MEWFQKGAKAGSPQGMNCIGSLYEEGKGVAADKQQAFQWYQRAASLGLPEGMNNLARAYHEGLGTTQDFKQAFYWLQKSALAGNADAMGNIGLHYRLGQGVTRDYGKAKEWLEKAVDGGNVDAINDLGGLYSEGLGVPRDAQKALDLYKRAAAGGNANAMGNIGKLYLRGDGVPQDYVRAKNWSEKAAAAGNIEAMNDLGVMYGKGLGVAIDPAKAFDWFKKAAEGGNSQSMCNVGICYLKGIGVPKDAVQAVDWLWKAAALGNEQAKGALEQLNIPMGQPLRPQSGQQYKIKFTRPHKVGDQSAMKVTSKVSRSFEGAVGGEHKKTNDVFEGLLEGTETDLSVSEKTGLVTKLSIRVDKLTKDGNEIYPAGTVVSVETVGGETVYTVAGIPMDAANSTLMGSLVDVSSPDETLTRDDSCGTDKPQRVGATWPINPDIAARLISKGKVKVDQKDLKGESTLIEVKKLNDLDVIVVKTSVSSEHCQLDLPNGISTSDCKFKADNSETFPVDETLPGISNSQDITATMTVTLPNGTGTGLLTYEREQTASWEAVKGHGR